MKAKSLILAISLAVNLVLGVMLWQRSRPVESGPVTQTTLSEEERLPLPSVSTPLTTSALLPPVDAEVTDSTGRPSTAEPAFLAPPDQDKPYSPPPPPNPHAYPAWPTRVPYRESQAPRALIADPAR